MMKNIDPAILDYLRAVGTAGAPSSEVAAATRRTADNAALHLGQAAAKGLVGWWPEPAGRSTKRRRWWLIEHLPARRPALMPLNEQKHGLGWRNLPKPAPVVGVQVCSGWTHDPRYQLAPDARVVGGFATLGIGRYIDDAP